MKETILGEAIIRKWTCPPYNAELDRDDNAATNIKVEGIRILLSY